MAIDFKKMLTPEAQKRMADADAYYEQSLIKFRNMTNKNLHASAMFYMTQMRDPWKHEFSTPTYDAVFWHVVIPELLRRIRKE